MNPFETFLAKAGPTVQVLDGFDRAKAVSAGFDPAVATQWLNLWRIYYGEKRFTRKREEALELALSGRFTLDQLRLIERRVAHIKDRLARWKLRIELLKSPCNYRQLEKRIEEVVPPKKVHRTKSLRLTASADGLRSLFVTADERDMADLEAHLREGLDPNKPAGPQMLKKFLEILRGEGGIPGSVRRPIVVVPLEAHTKILRGAGADMLLGLSDGTTMTGAEYLELISGRDLGGVEEVALFHPQEGAVNLYRAQRHANEKQRVLARLTHTVCPVPDCRMAADHCEIHHIKAWSQGGETNMSNLSVLCAYHNRVNWDNPAHRNRRGNIRVVGGAPMWVSPDDVPVANTKHPYGAMKVLFG